MSPKTVLSFHLLPLSSGFALLSEGVPLLLFTVGVKVISFRQRIDEVAMPKCALSFQATTTLQFNNFDQEGAYGERLWKGIEGYGKTAVIGQSCP